MKGNVKKAMKIIFGFELYKSYEYEKGGKPNIF
jgi:hypothetical protein